MAPERWLFWHRRDLRLADNRGLAAAAAATPAIRWSVPRMPSFITLLFPLCGLPTSRIFVGRWPRQPGAEYR